MSIIRSTFLSFYHYFMFSFNLLIWPGHWWSVFLVRWLVGRSVGHNLQNKAGKTQLHYTYRTTFFSSSNFIVCPNSLYLANTKPLCLLFGFLLECRFNRSKCPRSLYLLCRRCRRRGQRKRNIIPLLTSVERRSS